MSSRNLSLMSYLGSGALARLWDDFGMTFGWLLDDFEITLASLWDHDNHEINDDADEIDDDDHTLDDDDDDHEMDDDEIVKKRKCWKSDWCL